MTKKWTYADFEFALDSAWSAFENTLLTHGVTDEEIEEFFNLADSKIDKVGDYFSQVITWREEE